MFTIIFWHIIFLISQICLKGLVSWSNLPEEYWHVLKLDAMAMAATRALKPIPTREMHVNFVKEDSS